MSSDGSDFVPGGTYSVILDFWTDQESRTSIRNGRTFVVWHGSGIRHRTYDSHALDQTLRTPQGAPVRRIKVPSSLQVMLIRPITVVSPTNRVATYPAHPLTRDLRGLRMRDQCPPCCF